MRGHLRKNREQVLSNQDILSAIKKIPFFAYLTDEEISRIGTLLEKRIFYKNQIILHEKDTLNYMYVIVSGRVKVVQTDIYGRERILTVHKSGDFFGEMALLDSKTSPASIIAIEKTLMLLMSRDNFNSLLKDNPHITNQIVSILCARLRDAWLMIKVMRFSNAEQRVRGVLKLISDQNGVKDSRGLIITLKLTHEDIAGYASVARETVSRILKRLIMQGEIEISSDRYIVLYPSFFKKVIF